MSNYIVKISGKYTDVLTALKTLKAVYGESVALSAVARYKQVKNIIDKQLKNIKEV